MTPFLHQDRELRQACDELLLLVRRLRARPEEGGRGRRGLAASGTLFREHRRYVPGDDPRRVDWHAYARMGELHVKLFEADRTQVLPLLVDLSASLEFGRPPRWREALRAAAAVLFVALASGCQVELALSFGLGRQLLRSWRAGVELGEGWTFLEAARPGGRGTAAAAMAELLRRRRGAVVWWLSDFLPLDREALAVAVERRCRVRGLLPLVPQDAEPEAPPVARLRGLEGGGEATVRASSRLRTRVGALWQEEMQRVRARLGSTGGDLFLLAPGQLAAGLAPALV